MAPSDVKIEYVSVKVSLSSEMSFVFICVYHPPSARSDFYDQLKLLLNHFSSINEVILAGDLNINWDVKNERKTLKQIMDHHNFTQLIEQPTRLTQHSRTRIDLLFTTCPYRVTKTYNLLTGLSDHNAILFTRKLTKKRRCSLVKPINSTPLYDFIPMSQQQNLAAALHNNNWSDVLSCVDVIRACHLFNRPLEGGARKKEGTHYHS